ncbi:uncharacterized protein LOC129591834 [Paramacrobiotus metropolitanus]|uniref:uncharacterized protein LOC129591834 n=1 Tax=Paramacrobiotus metropolitanus TaxID=2943436 RepID=UPI002445F694|nr:uncharacterized protein LOC129591834 [Paramacrobiotus metropolitanus]
MGTYVKQVPRALRRSQSVPSGPRTVVIRAAQPRNASVSSPDLPRFMMFQGAEIPLSTPLAQRWDRGLTVFPPSDAAPPLAAAARAVEDPRPLTDKRWRREAMGKLLNVLEAHNFDWEHPKGDRLQLQHLLHMDLAMLRQIFSHLDGILSAHSDPAEKLLPATMAQRAREMGYPYLRKLTPNTFKAPNIPSSWPTVCGFLDWLREAVEAHRAAGDAGAVDAREAAGQAARANQKPRVVPRPIAVPIRQDAELAEQSGVGRVAIAPGDAVPDAAALQPAMTPGGPPSADA